MSAEVPPRVPPRVPRREVSEGRPWGTACRGRCWAPETPILCSELPSGSCVAMPSQRIWSNSGSKHFQTPCATAISTHGGGARASLRGPKWPTFKLCPKGGRGTQGCSHKPQASPECTQTTQRASHHPWSKVEKLTILALGGWPGHHHRGVLMAVAHGVWKCSEPLFGQVQWLVIAVNDPIGSSEQGIDVSGTQQSPLHAVPHSLPSETSRRGTRGGSEGTAQK